jgi:uncharacterized protein (TIGR02145 family)
MNYKFLILSMICTALYVRSIAQTGNDSLKTVTIDKQIWTQTNLSATKFRNGDDIPQAKSSADMERAARQGKPVWCYYDFDPDNDMKYGKLYNWYAVNDPRGIAPSGWHIPNNDEWNQLKQALWDKFKVEAGRTMKAEKGWKGNKASNESGFSAVSSGLMTPSNGSMYNKISAYFWTSSPLTLKKEGWHALLASKSDALYVTNNLDISCGMSVRCVKDK